MIVVPERESIFQPFGWPRKLGFIDESVLNDCEFINQDKVDHFQLNVDVQHFLPQELTLKVSDDRFLTIKCVHEEKKTDSCFSKYLIRKIYIPEKYDVNSMSAKLSSDGLLVVMAPLFKADTPELEGRNIPISRIGIPAEETKMHLKNKL